jgi:phosphoribosylformylglycinamidine synthase subunit PurL
VHDCSDGGLLVAIAEMALSGSKGVELYPYEGKLPAFSTWFGEDQGRYVLEVSPAQAASITDRARALGLPARVVGKVGGVAITLKGETALPLDDLRHVHESWFPGLMGAV